MIEYLIRIETIYNGNWTEWIAICIGNQMISSAIWNKYSSTNKFFNDYKKRKKNYECLFLPNCMRNII